MRQSVSTRLMLALVIALTAALAVAAQAAPAAQDEVGPAQGPGNPARIAIVHAAPFNLDGGPYSRIETAVTIVAARGAERSVLASGLVFGQTVPYLSVLPGTYTFSIFPGTLTLTQTQVLTPALTANTTLLSNRDYTAVAMGTGSGSYPLALNLLEDNSVAPGANQGVVRVIHAAPFDPTPGQTNVRVVDTTGGGNTVIVPSLVYSSTTNFLPIPAGTYNAEVLSNINNLVIIPSQELTITAGEVITVIAIGDDGFEPVGLLALPKAARGEALLRFVHAAPFATGNATASVLIDPDFSTDGNIPLTGLNFKGKTLYREVGPGTYTVKLYAGAVITGTPVLTTSLQLLDNTATTAVVVGKNTPAYPLQIELLSDKRTPAASASADVRFFHAAPFAASPAGTGVDIRAENEAPGTPAIVSNLLYTGVSSFLRDPDPPSQYLTVPSGAPIDLRVVRTGTQTDLFPVPAVTFAATSVQTIIAVGDGLPGAQGTTQPFDLIVLNDLQQTVTTRLPLIATSRQPQ